MGISSLETKVTDDLYHLKNFQNKNTKRCQSCLLLLIVTLFIIVTFCLVQIYLIRQDLDDLRIRTRHLPPTDNSREEDYKKDNLNNKNKRFINENYSTRLVRDHIVFRKKFKDPEESDQTTPQSTTQNHGPITVPAHLCTCSSGPKGEKGDTGLNGMPV